MGLLGDMNPTEVRKDFPFYDKFGDSLIYMDSACQTLRPRSVIDVIVEYYTDYPACAGRSVHRLATQVTLRVDEARGLIHDFFNAGPERSLVFTKNCTEAINVVAKGFPFKRGDVVLTSDVEHNSNNLPWQQMVRQRGIRRECVRTDERGILDLEDLKEKMSHRVKMVSLGHTSNVTGVSIPPREIIEIARDHDALVMLDGAQTAPHQRVDLCAMDVDFYTLSLHKMLGPSGVGALIARDDLLTNMEPLISGGGTVETAGHEEFTLLPPPERFEAGLLNYAGIIGSGEAVRYLGSIGMDEVEEHELLLNRVLTSMLMDIEGVEIIGPLEPELRPSLVSFNVQGLSSHDVAMIIDEMGKVLIRSGMHCAHPFFRKIGKNGCARASLYIYNTIPECRSFAQILEKLVGTFSR